MEPSQIASGDLSTSPTILLDAHVHLHRRFDPAEFLDRARANFRAAAGRARPPHAVGCLWLTDPPGERSLPRLAGGDGNRTFGRWSLSPTAEPTSLTARHESGDVLLLLGGRQLPTRERLEVLALGAGDDLAPGRSLGDTIAGVRERGALAVIPWGFGKWWGRRRRLLAETLAAVPSEGLFVGDNAGRPWLVPRSSLFDLAGSRGIFDLPGSDPLPLEWEIRKPGRLGCVLEGPLDLARPLASLTRILLGLRTQPPRFGRPESLPGFARSQVALRLMPQGAGAPAARARA